MRTTETAVAQKMCADERVQFGFAAPPRASAPPAPAPVSPAPAPAPLPAPLPTAADVAAMGAGALKRLCASLRVDTRGCNEKHELLALALAAVGGGRGGAAERQWIAR